MTVTYTTVWKDYPAATFEEAAVAMLRDPEVWDLTEAAADGTQQGQPKGYAVESWDWLIDERGPFLRVRFR